MIVEVNVKSSALGATLHCSGETADLLTDTEVNEAVDRIRSKLDQAAAEAKAAIRKHQTKGAYGSGAVQSN